MTTKRSSRPARWADACGKAEEALNELEELREEYDEWLSNLPENLQQSELASKLEAVTQLDLQGAIDTVQEAGGVDLPLGFGRD